ncbi:MAG: hypothetical protein SPF70_01540 [Lachnospiraceae bacterium]|nr:hypothetical protein [Lachnospiraceae bacterium]
MNVKEQVYNVLLMPIQCKEHSGFNQEREVQINNKGSIIETTQTYWPEYINKNTGKSFRYKFIPDCDMSDFACGFYEILYGDAFKCQKIVDENNGCLINKNFAGDTMISVSKLPGLKNKYHCLANFWILPTELGRKSDDKLSKTGHYYEIEDFMDRFLLLLKYKFEEYKKVFPDYFSHIEGFDNLSDVHFIKESYLDEHNNVLQFSNNINEKTEEYLWNCIKKRAEMIANSKFSSRLMEYFIRNNIIKNSTY